jgi:hypothetical protein
VPAFRRAGPGRLLGRLRDRLARRESDARGPYRVDAAAPAALAHMLRNDLDTSFARFARLGAAIDLGFARMQAFLRDLP